MAIRGKKLTPPLERFNEKVDRSRGSEGCHLWTASTNNQGYGQFYAKGFGGPRKTMVLAHRAAFFFEHGAFPLDGLMVLHRCDTPRCVNPAHFFVGDAAANMADMAKKGRHWMQTSPERIRRGKDHWTVENPGRMPTGEKHHWYGTTQFRGARNGNSRFPEDTVNAIRADLAAGTKQRDIAKKYRISQSQVSNINRGAQRALP